MSRGLVGRCNWKRQGEPTTMMVMQWDDSERAAGYYIPNDTCDVIECKAVKAGLEVFFEVVKEYG